MADGVEREDVDASAVSGVRVLTTMVENGSMPARTGRSVCKSLRQNSTITGLQHRQDAENYDFWVSAPGNQLLAAATSGMVTATDLCGGAIDTLVDRDAYAVLAALDDRALLAPAGDTARLQELFDDAAALTCFRSARVLLARHSEIYPASTGSKALAWACDSGDVAMVALLLADARVDPNNVRFWPTSLLATACNNCHFEMVRLLLADPRVDPAEHSNLAIITACDRGDIDIVRQVLRDGRADPSADSNRAIQLASEQGHAIIVWLLLADARVDPTADNNAALRAAQSRHHDDVVQLLLADGRASLPQTP